jgi:hypothetical protein
MNAMNYFIHNLFNDWKWWAKLGFAFVATMNMFDIVSQGLFFNLWIVRGTVIAGCGGLIVYFVYFNRRDKKNSRIEALLPAFIAGRHVYFEKIVAADPKFQTFCYECLHYDAVHRTCSLRLYDRKIWIKLDPFDPFSYCLYWNLNDHPLLALTDKTTAKTEIS